MFELPSPPNRKTWIAAFASLASLSGAARSQDFTMMVTDPNPLGLGAFVPDGLAMDLGLKGRLKGAFGYGVGVKSVYNTNFFQTEENEESELTAVFSPWITYVSDPEGGATFSLVANYSPSYRTYLENSELKGLDQSGDVTFSARGSRTQMDLFARRTQVSGTDRLTGEFIEGTVTTAGFRASRQVASRTSIDGGWSYGQSDYGDSDSEGSTIQTANIGGLWDATERVSLGASLRYTLSESENISSQDAWALLLQARYRVGERIWLSASIGPEYSRSSEGGSDDVRVTGDINARYVINERWTWTNTFRAATVPSPSETNFVVNDYAFTTGLQRQLLKGSLSLGLVYNFSDYTNVGDSTDTISDENNAGLSLGYQRGFFMERLDFDTSVRYTLNNGQTDWSQWLVTAGLRLAF